MARSSSCSSTALRTGTGAPHGPDTVGSCHLSLQVADLRSALSRLAGGGFRPAGQPARLTEGGVWQDCTVVYLRDPDGVFVELIERGAGG